MRALAKNPANRYQTADEFRADLERARLGQDVLATPLMPPGGDATQVISRPQATAVLPPQESAPGSGRKVWLGVLIGFIVVAVLGGAGYLLAQGLLGNNDDTTTPFPVANVIGFTQERATQELEDAGLKVEPEVQGESTRSSPVASSTRTPSPGTIVDPGSTVIITIAKAPPPVVVPTFTGLTLGDAQTLATENHLVLVPTEGQSDTVPVGSVISQDPPPGEEVAAGDRDRDRRVGPARYGGRDRCHVPLVRLGEVRAPGARLGRPSSAGPRRSSRSARTRTGSRSRIRPPAPWSTSGAR